MRRLVGIAVVVALWTTVGSTGLADEANGGGGMDPAMMEKMEKMEKLTSPSDAHKVFEPLVGRWTYTGEFWMSPDAPPQPMTGTSVNTIVFGGRFLKQQIEGPWMDQTFHGLGFTGYDNIKGEYVSTWLDSMSTGIMTVSGHYDPTTRTLTQAGANSCPLTGEKDRHSRSEWTITDRDHSTYTSYMAGADGKEFKAMQITYTRVP